MKNERGAGRKSKISEEEFVRIYKRYENGESIAKLAGENGVSRQALSKRISAYVGMLNSDVRIEYMIDDECATLIEINPVKESVHIVNYARRLSMRAFGTDEEPSWEKTIDFFERSWFLDKNIEIGKCVDRFVFGEEKWKDFHLSEIDKTLKVTNADNLPRFEFTHKELLASRTDTDGYQLKAMSADRKYFVKAQACIGGVWMNDWKVEKVASDICETLGIPHVNQRPCEFVYGKHSYKGVYSRNFELDGYTFFSFEGLLERKGKSTVDSGFIHLDAISKLKWCAEILSDISGIEYEKTIKYMIDLAVVDCLVGNVDRHTRNFGLFYDTYNGCWSIPLVFDNGMGMFEHDRYRDEYKTYEEAMRTVYVAPYGEDPFDMMEMLKETFDLHELYPDYDKVTYVFDNIGQFEKCGFENLNTFAKEYAERMLKLWLK